MSTTRRLINVLSGMAFVAVLVAGGLFVASPQARADGIIFLTRLNTVIATYPSNAAFNVGSSTPQGGAAKLGVSLNVTDTRVKAFEVASTTGTGTATTSADIFLVKNTGCIQVTSTSSATQIKLTFNATTTQGSTNNGVLDWAYGTCP